MSFHCMNIDFCEPSLMIMSSDKSYDFPRCPLPLWSLFVHSWNYHNSDSPHRKRIRWCLYFSRHVRCVQSKSRTLLVSYPSVPRLRQKWWDSCLSSLVPYNAYTSFTLTLHVSGSLCLLILNARHCQSSNTSWKLLLILLLLLLLRLVLIPLQHPLNCFTGRYRQDARHYQTKIKSAQIRNAITITITITHSGALIQGSAVLDIIHFRVDSSFDGWICVTHDLRVWGK